MKQPPLRSTTETAGISTGDPLPLYARPLPSCLCIFFPCVFAPLRLCVYFFRNSRDLPVHHVAAVDVDRLAGDLPGKRRRKKDNHRRDVLRRLPIS